MSQQSKRCCLKLLQCAKVDYILQHPQDVIDMNAKQLSQACFVSTSSIYRLCEKIELSFNGEIKPIIIKNPEDENLIQLIVPIKTY